MTVPRLAIEIGSGVGWHAIQYSKAHPDTMMVAIEKTANKFEKLDRRRKNHPELTNLFPVHSNAINWISAYVGSASVDEYFILYPNPYPKDPQKRWFGMPFMSYLIETLKPGGQLTLATNIESYYLEAKKYNDGQWGLKIILDSIVSKTEKPRTHFEKKYLERGEACYNLVFQKL